jgi:hypothetical protein
MVETFSLSGARIATQVHHHTYEHCCNEPLFELGAICRGCHRGILGIEDE